MTLVAAKRQQALERRTAREQLPEQLPAPVAPSLSSGQRRLEALRARVRARIAAADG